MDDFDILFFHGKESGPHGSKYQSLSREFEVHSPDFQGMDIYERLDVAKAFTERMEGLIVVGSSYGGLLAALLYSEHPERFHGYILLAPALLLDVDAIERMPDDAVVIHGNRDEVVPFEPTKEICDGFDVEVIEVDDGHRLRESHDLIVEQTRQMLARRSEARDG